MLGAAMSPNFFIYFPFSAANRAGRRLLEALRLPARRRSPRARPPRTQRGVALLTALFIVALATVAAVSMVSESAIAIRRTANLQDSEQAEWYALGVEAWVCQLLADAEKNKDKSQDYDSLGDTWAQPLTLPVDYGVISGYLEDLQGRFNLNNLNTQPPKPYYEQLTRLLENVPGVDPFAASGLGPAIKDWIDADSERSEGGAEDESYLALDIPYRAGNQQMRSPSELHAVRGVTPDLYSSLAPLVATLPISNAKVNINTAPLPVLASLTAQPNTSALQAFVKTRLDHPLTSISDAGQADLFPGATNLSQLADVKTSWFLMHATVKIGDGHLVLLSVISRSGTSGTTTQSPVTVVSHSFGTE